MEELIKKLKKLHQINKELDILLNDLEKLIIKIVSIVGWIIILIQILR